MNEKSDNSLLTAINLRRAIEAIPGRMHPLGRQKLAEWIWVGDHTVTEEKDTDQWSGKTNLEWTSVLQTVSDISRIAKGHDRVVITTPFDYSIWKKMNLTIHVSEDGNDLTETKGFRGNIYDLKLDELLTIYEYAQPAFYGDQKQLETVHDETVRKSREITNFSVSPEIDKEVEAYWEKHFLIPCQAQPYKINLYRAGDFFKEHKDTPDKELVGTVLIGLGCRFVKDWDFKSFVVKDVLHDESISWKADKMNVCAFYSDCPHEVQVIPDGDQNIRATLSYKIYAAPEAIQKGWISRNPDDKLNLAIDVIYKKLYSLVSTDIDVSKANGKFGVILSYDYSLHTEALKGADKIFIKAVQRFPKVDYQVIPVLISDSGEWECNDEEAPERPTYTSRVYPLTEECIQNALNVPASTQSPPFSEYRKLPFYDLADPKSKRTIGFLWKSKEVDAVRWTGNESRPGEIDSLYVQRAVIVKGFDTGQEPQQKKQKK